MRARPLARFAVSTVPTLFVGLVGCASSDQHHDWDREGFTIGVGGIGALERFDLDDQQAVLGSNITVEQPTFGGEGRVGYRFHPAIALEGVFQQYSEFEFEQHDDEFASGRAWAATGNIKAYLAPGPLQPYALAGLGAMSLDVEDDLNTGLDLDETEMMWRFGAGIDAYVSGNVLLYGECTYNMPFDDLEDFRFLAIAAGVQFRF